MLEGKMQLYRDKYIEVLRVGGQHAARIWLAFLFLRVKPKVIPKKTQDIEKKVRQRNIRLAKLLKRAKPNTCFFCRVKYPEGSDEALWKHRFFPKNCPRYQEAVREMNENIISKSAKVDYLYCVPNMEKETDQEDIRINDMTKTWYTYICKDTFQCWFGLSASAMKEVQQLRKSISYHISDWEEWSGVVFGDNNESVKGWWKHTGYIFVDDGIHYWDRNGKDKKGYWLRISYPGLDVKPELLQDMRNSMIKIAGDTNWNNRILAKEEDVDRMGDNFENWRMNKLMHLTRYDASELEYDEFVKWDKVMQEKDEEDGISYFTGW